MAYKTNSTGQQIISVADDTGVDITATNRFPVDAKLKDSNNNDIDINNPLAVSSTVLPADQGCGSLPGSEMRYDKVDKVDLARNDQSFTTVYEITEESVFYRALFDVNSDNIRLQIEIDGQDIFPGSDGFTFEELETLGLGGTAGTYNSQYGGGGKGEGFGLYQYDSNRWIWQPPCPLYVGTNMKIKMKASTNTSSRDAEKTLVIRRSLA